MNEITLMSFGYLFGLPEDADTIIGVRGLPNPYWVDSLKHKTGLDEDVRDYVFSTPEAGAFFDSCLDLLRRRIAFHEAYDSPLKKPLVIALGCSGGKHRSVSMAIRLAEALGAEGRELRVVHRDLEKKFEHSAGAVVFTREAGEPRFVIVESLSSGVHGCPKGRMEEGETDLETALREVREETGLTPRILPGFRTVELYPLRERPNTVKQVIYYLAEYENQTPRPRPGEIRSVALLSYDEAMRTFEFENTRRVLTEAYAFLNQTRP
jgi:ADP-ribose pyrophosphatase YjhB (NUDIX family)